MLLLKCFCNAVTVFYGHTNKAHCCCCCVCVGGGGAVANPDRGEKGRFSFPCPAGFSPFCHFFFLPKISGGGGGGRGGGAAAPLDPSQGCDWMGSLLAEGSLLLGSRKVLTLLSRGCHSRNFTVCSAKSSSRFWPLDY